MPVAMIESLPVGQPLPRKRFTATEVQSMLATGLFAGQRFELIHGDFIDKSGQDPRHASAIQLCMEIFIKLLRSVRVSVQLPMEAGPADRERNEPEPDVAVLVEPKTDYRRRHPKGEEMALVIEVANTTLQPDLTTKRDLYARAGVREYWVLDLNGRRLVVHRALGAAKDR
jgi:Uma2 family endonuclease